LNTTAATTATPDISSSMKPIIDNWIAFDLEWEIEPKYSENNIISRSQQTLHNADFTSGTSVPPAQDYRKILTFGYEDSYGNNGTFDILDFRDCPNPERAFLEAIKAKLLQYRYCFAWGSKAVRYKNQNNGNLEGIDGDLVMLDVNFRQNHIPSIVRYNKYSKVPYIKSIDSNNNAARTTDIDLLQVFAKPLVKYVIFKNKYKSLKLQEVAIQLLGHGKLDNKSGSNILNMSAEERKSYCKHDAHLAAELVKVNNGDILKIMQVIADHTGLRLEEVCQKGMTGIWTKILNDAVSKKAALVGYDNLPFTLRKLYSNKHQAALQYNHIAEDFDEWESEDEEAGYDIEDNREEDRWYCPKSKHSNSKEIAPDKPYKKYKGAIVLDPVRGLHHDVYVFDVTSLYPTMIIKYNLSPETVNCSCCKNDLRAKETVASEILKDCNYIPEKDGGCYWICRRKRGLFAKILQNLTEQRIKYKNAVLEVESQAIKAIINSGYGVFGHPYFKYHDPRVAELVTAFGRYTLNKMRAIADELGFHTLYGDTDSLFVNNVKSIDECSKFIDECKSRLGIDVTQDKTFSKLILVGKKHYIGISSGLTKEPIIKGMEGMKSDRPKFIHRAFRQLVNDIKNDTDPIPKLKDALRQLENRRVSPKLLAISLVMRKNPEEYEQNCNQSRLGSKLGLRKGDTLVYYKCNTGEITYDSENPQEISYTEYKKMLINSIRDVLQILGYDIDNDLLLADKTELIESGQSNTINKANSTSDASISQIDSSVTNKMKERRQMVSEGINIFLSLFAAVGQRLFPRTIMTKCTNGQVVVYNKNEIMYYSEACNYEDCRINAYQASKTEEQEYKNGIKLNLLSPNILFIDLDAKKFTSDRELRDVLKQILKNIAYLLDDCKPLVLWSGHGYHIIIPVKCKALESSQDLTQYTPEPSKEFLQFAERHLSLNKADPANNPSLKSCLLRVPHTFNSECLEEGIDAEVKVVQQWDSSIQPPSIDNLLVEFQTFLIDKKLKADSKQWKNASRSCDHGRVCKVGYIENILNLQLADHRKFIVSLILAPYFANIQKLTDTESFSRIKEWVLKCNTVKELEPSISYFDDLINRAIERAKDTGIRPLKFEETLQYKNRELYNMLYHDE
jgi:DNA polymerase family B/Primase X